jgi:hypothetical protein
MLLLCSLCLGRSGGHRRGVQPFSHYVEKGWNFFKSLVVKSWGKVLQIRIFNGPEGSPTVVIANLPGHSFDGTSCFNIFKEVLHRYHGGEPNGIVIPTTLNAKADRQLRQASFVRYLALLPYNVLLNTSDFVWMFMKSQPFFGGAGLSFEVTLLNFNEEESKKIVAGLKKLQVKPYGAFIGTGFNAYRDVLKQAPFSVVQQSSLQSRCYEPILKERRFVGDWLVGVLHHFNNPETFTLQDGQNVYENLIDSLNNMDSAALDGTMAKAYCLLGGAAVYEFFPFYGDRMRVFDSIFLNNYGPRELHPDSGFVSYNWAAPFRLGYNTVCVNGRTTICFASSHMSLKKLRLIRDHVHDSFRKIMAEAE